MNIILDITNSSVDPLDNPYFNVKPYVLDNNQTWIAREPIDDEVKLIKCPKEEIQKYLGNNSAFFSSPVCFDKSEKLEINSNWWRNRFKSYFISIEVCKESLTKKCASEAERKQFFENTRINVVTGEMKFN